MKIKLLKYIPLSNAVIAGRTAWQSFHKGGNYELPTDNITKEDFEFIDRLFNKYKHISVAEHIWYTFEINVFNIELMFKVKNEYNFFSIKDNTKNNKLIFSVNLRTILEEVDSVYTGNHLIKDFYWELINYLPKNHQRLFGRNKGKDIDPNNFIKISNKNILGHKVELLYHYSVRENVDFERRPHSFYTFRLSGFSRALLQELVRHDDLLAITGKSTRYTLKELKNEMPFNGIEDIERAKKYIIPAINVKESLVEKEIKELEMSRQELQTGVSNDKAKYLLPESYRSEVFITLNENNLNNLLKLRTDKAALWEFQYLANLIKEII